MRRLNIFLKNAQQTFSTTSKEKKRKYDELIAYQEKIFDETLAFALKKNKTAEEEEEMERKIAEMEEETETFLNKN